MKVTMAAILVLVVVSTATAELKNGKKTDKSAFDPVTILSEADGARGDVKGLIWRVKIDAREGNKATERILELKVSGTKLLAVFTEPARIRGRKLVMHDRNMWFVKPDVRKPVPISPRQKLVGGAAYGDIASTRYAKDYQVQEMKEDLWNGEDCFLLELKAVNKQVTYARIRYWISKKRLVGVKAKFYTTSGKMLKSATFDYKNTITLSGIQKIFVSRMIITDAIVKEHVTTLEYDRIQVKEISDSAFDLNLLTK